MNRIWSASFERGKRLAKAGCELPYLSVLPGRNRFHQRALSVGQIGGYCESLAIDRGESTAYVIALRVGTDRSAGAIVTNYSFTPPWPDHAISWDYDPEDVLPEGMINRYKELFESRLLAVLNRRELLYRGRPVGGLLCGCSWSPIPASTIRERPAMAEIVLSDDSGSLVRSVIELAIRKAGTCQRDRTGSRNTGVISGAV